MHSRRPSGRWGARARAAAVGVTVAAAVSLVGIASAGGAVAGHGAARQASTAGSFQYGSKLSRRTAAAVRAADLPQSPAQTPKYSCATVGQQDFSRLQGAPTTILSAEQVNPGAGAGTAFPYCDVKGIVAPQVQFELQLPTQTYTGRYLQEGCGGYCGHVGVSQPAASGQAGINECVPLNNGEFALGQDDEGHIGSGSGNTEAWATDPQLKVDFGYRSEHVFAIAAKAIIGSFYGQAPSHSYYDGCSDGGREALMEAQRFPHDFQGIIAGAPAFNQAALNAMEEPYESRAAVTPDGQAILTAPDAAVLHNAVISQCADPRLMDGTIQDPRDCKFDWSKVQCASGATDTSNCLTAEQVAAAKRLYAGAVAPDGEHLYTGGEPLGAESGWPGIVIPATNTAPPGQTPEDTTFFHNIGVGYLRWVGLWKVRPSLDIDDFAFNRRTFDEYANHYNRKNVSAVVDATDPDLTAFYRAGGKLIMWHGWADQFIPPAGSLAYRQAVIDTMGASTVDRFYRLYMFPGVYHCGGGYGPAVFDLLTPMIDWVEGGQAPNAIVAAKVSGGDGPPGAGPSARTVELTRPVFPYPKQVKYSGSGDPDSASSLVGFTPSGRHDDDIKWAGYPFRPGYELWCDPRGRRLSCRRRG